MEKKMPKPTYAELEKSLASCRQDLQIARAAEAKLRNDMGDWADLKIRLLAAERSNEYLRGYVARVQEDDIVREELVTVGDPEGERHLKPKRTSTTFTRPDDFTMPAHTNEYGRYIDDNERRRKAKHWITYGG